MLRVLASSHFLGIVFLSAETLAHFLNFIDQSWTLSTHNKMIQWFYCLQRRSVDG